MIEEHLPESHFRHNPDTVEYSIKGRGREVGKKKRQVIPDDYMLIRDRRLQSLGQPSGRRILLEIDLRTHNNPRLKEKLAAYAAYLGSPEYRGRLHTRTVSGRWFFVTTGEVRMKNLMLETERVAGRRAKFFCFSVFSLVLNKNVFTEPIWWQPRVGGPLTLANVH